jgi:malate permease and related proteins
MPLLQLFADNLLPILLVAGAGYALAAALRVDARGFSAVAFNLFAPCLVFQVVLDSRVPPDAMLRMAGFTLASLVAPAALALAVARWRRWPRPLASAVVLCVLLPNAGNYGMSANLIAFGPQGLTQASLYFIVLSITTYTVGVLVASLGRASLAATLSRLTRVPAIWAVGLAFAIRGARLTLPGPLAHAVAMIASACIPAFLVILGIQLRGARLRGPARPLLFAAALRLIGGPAAGFLMAPWFGLAGPARQAGIFQSAMPTAVITTILATEYEVEPELVSSVVLLTTLLSPLTLTPLLAWLK